MEGRFVYHDCELINVVENGKVIKTYCDGTVVIDKDICHIHLDSSGVVFRLSDTRSVSFVQKECAHVY